MVATPPPVRSIRRDARERFVGRCRKCKRGYVAEVVARIYTGAVSMKMTFELVSGAVLRESLATQGPRIDCACGHAFGLREVRGTYNPHKKCGARCLHATGHDCECACGGKNHGAGNETIGGAA